MENRERMEACCIIPWFIRCVEGPSAAGMKRAGVRQTADHRVPSSNSTCFTTGKDCDGIRKNLRGPAAMTAGHRPR